MKINLKTLASLVLASALTAAIAQTASGTASTTPKKTVHRSHKTAVPAKPSVESQIEALRNDLQGQIQTLKQQLNDRDTQLQQAQQAAAAAQAAALQAQQAANQQQQALSDNSQAVTSLQGAVTDLKANSASIVTTIQDDQKQVQKAINNPDALHFKGITLSPTGSYLAGETVWRQRATGGDIPTAFTGIPFENSDLAKQSEFFGSGRQSRAALLAEGKVGFGSVRGYYEADWLGTGTSSNNNQSNSYVLRQRQLLAQAELKSGLTFTGGQMWSLATETKSGLSNRTELPPLSIDPNYVTGFVWTRQYGFRAVQSFKNKFFIGAAIENPQTLAPTLNGDATGVPLGLWGAPGTNGGNYNAAISTVSNACTTTQNSTTGAFTTTCAAIPSPITTYALNASPDFIVKLAADPGWGHYELFGIARLFRNRIYPNVTTQTIAAKTQNTVGAYNDVEPGAGIGGGFRVPTLHKKLDVGLKGLWGAGVGRYGNSTISDVTVKPDGQFSPLHGFSALSTLELHATPRLDIYANYGGDYIFRTRYANAVTGKPMGYGVGLSNAGCLTEPVPTGTTGGPNGLPATACAGSNKDVQEFTLGYWYDFYKGPMGRLRQSIQYAYAERQSYPDAAGIGPKGIDNMIWTSFRYYLP
jgi:hypothetical protein